MFQSKTAVAINFSDYSVEALELVRTNKTFAVKSRSRVVLDGGVIESGKIIQTAALAAAVTKLLAQAQPQPIRSREVAITIPESRIYAQSFELPKSLSAKQVPSALFSEARESMPLDPASIAADYRMVGTSDTAARYLFAATYSSFIEEYVSFFQGLHLKVSLITMESVALGAAVLDDAADETVLMLDIGARTTIASIFRRGELQESININIAGNNLTAALAEKLKLGTSAAEEKKKETGLTPGADGAEMLIIQGQLQPLKDELLVFMRYYEQHMADAVDRVLLAGGTASMRGLSDYFAANLNVPTQTATPLPIFQIEPDPSQVPKFLVVLGLARIAAGEGPDRINFLEHREKDWTPSRHVVKEVIRTGSPGSQFRRQGIPRQQLLLLLLLVLAAGVFGWFWWSRSKSAIPQAGPDGSAAAGGITLVARPYGTAKGERSLAFSYWVAFQEDTVQPGDFSGIVEEIPVRAAVPYDDGTVELVKRRIREQGFVMNDLEIEKGLKDVLSDTVWEEKVAERNAQLAGSGRRMLETYLSKQLGVSKSNTGTDAETAEKQLEISVTFRGIIVSDAKKVGDFEQTTVDTFLDANPGYAPTGKRYTMKIDDPDRAQVFAIYWFDRTVQ